MWRSARARRRARRVGGRSPLPARLRQSFALRLLIGMALTLTALGTVEYHRVGKDLERRLHERALVQARADAQQIAWAQANAPDGDHLAAVARTVKAIGGARPHLEAMELVDRRGRVVAAYDVARVGAARRDGRVRGALGGEGWAGRLPAAGGGGVFASVVPVYLADGAFALAIAEDDAVLAPELADLRSHTLRFLLIGVPLGVALMYLLAGRSLARRHRAVVETSMRDGLTGLGNHRAFQEELRRAVAVALRHDEPLTLGVIDLDDFKLANDRHGHGYGDRLLTELATLLETNRREDRAFRLGGDEFALIMPRTELEGARVALERLRASAETALSGVTVSAGVAELERDAPNVDGLVQAADTALYEAKRRGRNGVATFHDVESGSALVTAEKVAALRSLLDEGDLDAAFQPIWELSGDGLIGYEALARPGAAYGFDGPAEAFRIAEAIGRAHQLDHLCVRTILDRVGDLPAGALLFVNVSPQTLDHDLLAGDALAALVEAAGLEPERIVLEITERASAHRGRVVERAAALRERGFRLALDDAGAGNAGLEMLSSLPVDFVKIDRDVVRSAVDDRGARAVLAAILAFASQSGAEVIAEGIESEAMLAFVRDPERHRGIEDARIHGAQGFLLGRPEPAPAAARAA